ncbi:class I SAM-dependent methyltransferase, partial [Candidatus Parcubacteria bacterium]
MNSIALLIMGIIIGSAAIAGLSAAPWIPSTKRQQKLLINNIKIKPNDNVFDLGCGTGTLLKACLEKAPQANYYGIELSLLPYLIAKIRFLKTPNVKIKFGNLFKTNL